MKKLANRSVSLRSCMELWAWAQDIPTLHKNLQLYPKCSMETYFHPEKTFKIEVETFCKHISQSEKVAKIEVLPASLQIGVNKNVNLRLSVTFRFKAT